MPEVKQVRIKSYIKNKATFALNCKKKKETIFNKI